MNTRLLHADWLLTAVGNMDHVPEDVKGKSIRATVPGCVHTDLLAAGLIPDPYMERNELLVSWVAETDWQYSCSFDADESILAQEHIELACEGLDTVAEIVLNGDVVGTTENMHCAYRFDVRSALKSGANELKITFTSALTYTRAFAEKLGSLPKTMPDDYNYIRKMACNFGWDWGPTLTTAGIWKPISLQSWDTARIASVRPLVMAADAASAQIDVYTDLAVDDASGLTVSLSLTDPAYETADETVYETSFPVDGANTIHTVTVDNPELWWPRGYGEQPLYTLDVAVQTDDGVVLDEWSGRLGLRTARLNTDADDIGTRFRMEINGKPVFCKGANWIPDDCFPTRVTEARYRERLEQAADMKMNMLRVWGGGLYEQDDFYDICDELGIMIWQDFLFACAAYCEDDPFPRLIEEEARHNITRLSRHPSLVLWNGNNENIWGYFDWNWQEALQGKAWGAEYYHDLLPKLVAELDPSRSYWAGSPYSGTMDIDPNDDNHGCKHVWDAWNQVDYAVYRKYTPRFVSEFGHQAHPTWATLARVVPPEERTMDSATMLLHQKAADGHNKLNTRLSEHFAMPDDFDDWLYLTQVNQARAIITGVEWYRTRMPICMGTLYWQINDCWPVTSWASVDGDGRPKPLYYATRRFYGDRLYTFQPEDCGLVLHAVNDTDEAWSDDLTVKRMTFAGEVLAESNHAVRIPPRTSTRVCLLDSGVVTPGDPAAEMLVAGGNRTQATYFFDIDRNLTYPLPEFDTGLTRTDDEYRLTISAKTLLRDLCVFVDRLDADAEISDNLGTLLPGEEFTFVIRSGKQLDEESLTRAPVLVCVNNFGAK